MGFDRMQLRVVAVSLLLSAVLATPRLPAPGDPECAICLDHVGENGRQTQLPCGHTFCANCIEQWLQRQLRCATCRTEVPWGMEQVEEDGVVVFRHTWWSLWWSNYVHPIWTPPTMLRMRRQARVFLLVVVIDLLIVLMVHLFRK